MAKSIRSHVKKRYRACKRERVEALLEKPRRRELHKKMVDTINGTGVEETKKKNGFLYPNHPESEIPQSCIKTPIDFRSEHMPMSGYCFTGNRRKYTGLEAENREKRIKTEHTRTTLRGGSANGLPELDDANFSDDENMEVEEDKDMEDKDTLVVNEDAKAGEFDLSSMMLPPAGLKEVDTKRIPVVQEKKKKAHVRAKTTKAKSGNRAHNKTQKVRISRKK